MSWLRTSLRSLPGSLAAALLACGPLQQEPEDRGGSGYAPTPETPTVEPTEGVEVQIGPADLRVDPGSSKEVLVEVSPPGVYEVTLAVIGDANGAFLDRDRARTAPDGTTRARLTVRFETEDLGVLAVVEGHRAELDVEVGRALATVVVEPVYTGQRDIDEWQVGVLHDGRTCPDTTRYEVEGQPFDLGDHIEFLDVPAARPVHVFVRGKGYAFGCVPDVGLLPGAPNRVVVQVNNRPIQLGGLEMALALSFDRTPELDGTLRTISDQMLAAFRVGLSSDVDALVAAMAEMYALRAPSYGRGRFEEEAAEWRWPERVATHLAAHAGSGNSLSTAAGRWIAEGSAALWAPDGFLFGTLTSPGPGGGAALRVSRLGALAPETAGVSTRADVLLTTTSDDSITAGFTLGLRASRLLGELAGTVPEVAEHGGVTAALRTAVDCFALAESLASAADDAEEPLPRCGSSCMGQLCDDGLSFLWAQALQVQAAETPLEVSAGGPADIDEQARPNAFQGLWAGQAELFPDTEAVRVGGPFRAEVAEP